MQVVIYVGSIPEYLGSDAVLVFVYTTPGRRWNRGGPLEQDCIHK